MRHFIFLRVIRPKTTWGGLEKRFLDYFEQIDFSQCRVTFISNFDIYSQRFAERKLPVTFKPFPRRNTEDYHLPFKDMLLFLTPLKADAIILAQGAFTDFTFTDFLAAYIASKGRVFSLEALGAPMVEQKISRKYFGLIPGFALWWYTRMALRWLQGRLCLYNIAVGNEVRDRLVRWYHYPSDKTITIYHGIDLKKFKPDSDVRKAMREKYNIPDAVKVVVSTARLSSEKCVDRLIEAFDQLNDPGSWLLIVGDGVQLEKLKGLALQKVNGHRIIFTGFQDSAPYLQMADVFVLPSDIEGLSNAMIEAMATGLIVVVTDVPGAREVIDSGSTGFIVRRSVNGVKEGIHQALSMNEMDARKMIIQARKVILEKFDIQKGIQNCLSKLEIPLKG